jgi:hypothetical protein
MIKIVPIYDTPKFPKQQFLSPWKMPESRYGPPLVRPGAAPHRHARTTRAELTLDHLHATRATMESSLAEVPGACHDETRRIPDSRNICGDKKTMSDIEAEQR